MRNKNGNLDNSCRIESSIELIAMKFTLNGQKVLSHPKLANILAWLFFSVTLSPSLLIELITINRIASEFPALRFDWIHRVDIELLFLHRNPIDRHRIRIHSTRHMTFAVHFEIIAEQNTDCNPFQLDHWKIWENYHCEHLVGNDVSNAKTIINSWLCRCCIVHYFHAETIFHLYLLYV